MKKRKLMSVVMMLLVGAVAVAQPQRKEGENYRVAVGLHKPTALIEATLSTSMPDRPTYHVDAHNILGPNDSLFLTIDCSYPQPMLLMVGRNDSPTPRFIHVEAKGDSLAGARAVVALPRGATTEMALCLMSRCAVYEQVLVETQFPLRRDPFYYLSEAIRPFVTPLSLIRYVSNDIGTYAHHSASGIVPTYISIKL